MTAQLITPNPDIWCKPGYCLMYVRQTYGLDGLYPSATAGWNAAQRKHRDWNFPAGVWVPVWFSLATNPLGHVALLAPDGSVYSTSDDSNTPHHHPNMSHLIRYYAGSNPLTFLGWTEDIEGVTVVAGDYINLESSTITPEGDITVAEADRILEYIKDLAADGWTDAAGKKHPGFMLVGEENQRRLDSLTTLILPGEDGKRLAGPIPQMLADLQGGQRAILAALENLGNGQPIDVDAMKAAAKAGAEEALAGLEAIATTTVTLSQEG